MTELLLSKKCCNQCLTTKNRIVSGKRAAEIVKTCRNEDIHFVCHKSNNKFPNVHCSGMHKINNSKSYRFAKSLGIKIKEIDMDEAEKNKDNMDYIKKDYS